MVDVEEWYDGKSGIKVVLEQILMVFGHSG